MLEFTGQSLLITSVHETACKNCSKPTSTLYKVGQC